MASQGPFLPASGTNVGSGDSWTNPGLITAADASLATVTCINGNSSKVLSASDFGFTIPTDATIDGIVVEIDNPNNPSGTAHGFTGISIDGTFFTGDQKVVALNNGVWEAYGALDDLWNATLTPADVNTDFFAIFFYIIEWTGSGSATVNVDAVRVTVYYTPAGPPPQVARPVATVAAGSWTAVGAGTIHEALDETTFSDSDYAESADATGTPDEFKVRLGTLTDPAVGTGHIVRYRYKKKLLNGDRIDLTVTLYRADGTTVVATQTINDIEGVTTGTLTLSGTEADSIPSGDYATGLVLGFKEVKV